MPFDPDAFLGEGGFDPDAFLAEDKPKPSLLDAVYSAGSQGLSFRTSDEISGRLGQTAGEGSYESIRDQSRAANKAAKEEWPNLYPAVELGGNIVSAGLAGLAAPVLAPTSLAGMAAMGGAQLGLNAFGGSEAENPMDLAMDTAKGVGTGILAGGAGNLLASGAKAAAPYLAKGVSAVGDIAKSGLNKVGKLGDYVERGGEYVGKQFLGGLNNKLGTNFDTGAEKLTSSLLPDAGLKGSEIGKRLLNTAIGAGSLAGGSLAGVPIAAPIGIATGVMQAGKILSKPFMEKVGSPVLQKLGESASALGPYGKVLMDAMTRGPGAAATTDYLLQKASPEYREMRSRALGSEISE